MGTENSNLMTEFLKHLFGLFFVFFFSSLDFLFMYMMHIPCIDEKLQTNDNVKVA